MYRLAAASFMALLMACAATEPMIVDSSVPEAAPPEAPTAAEAGQIEFADAPAPPQQDVPLQANVPTVVCQLERRTGTNRKVRVCREQTSADDAAAARETFDSLRRQQVDLHQ